MIQEPPILNINLPIKLPSAQCPHPTLVDTHAIFWCLAVLLSTSVANNLQWIPSTTFFSLQVLNAERSHDAVDDLCSSFRSLGSDKEFLIVEKFCQKKKVFFGTSFFVSRPLLQLFRKREAWRRGPTGANIGMNGEHTHNWQLLPAMYRICYRHSMAANH